MYKFLFLTYVFSLPLFSQVGIDNISPRDQQSLEYFFKYLINRTSLGYTLCGEKPCSIETFPCLSNAPPKHALKIFIRYPAYSIMKNGWTTWTKYKDHFNSENFVFRFIPQNNTLVLINKKATRKVIEDNIDLFHRYSNPSESLDYFLKQVCQPTDQDYFIKSNIILLGILLGYGRNNSLAFAQRGYLQNLKKFCLYGNSNCLNVIHDPGFISIQNGTNEIENKKILIKLRNAKKNIRDSFKNQQYFNTFTKIYSN
ncbi:MAG: hypothetical protein H0W88_09055 [Parachlamydiaceae bacterium]|nr:hypothetical protein [Parachlamydiaceae bacterium]